AALNQKREGMIPTARLSGVYARIERAQLDCERFVREAVAYPQTSPEPITCETEFVRRHVLIGGVEGRVRFKIHIPLPDWCLLVADIVTDLRRPAQPSGSRARRAARSGGPVPPG